MIRICLLLVILFGCNVRIHQKNKYGTSNKLEIDYSAFIPIEYEKLMELKHDLNSDGYEDVLLVLNNKNEVNLFNLDSLTERKLLIIIGHPNHKYELVKQSNKLVYEYGSDLNFKDPLTNLEALPAGFSISYYGGFNERWSRVTTFIYSNKKKNWFLSKDEYYSFESTNPDHVFEDVTLTEKDFGSIPIDSFNINVQLKK